MEKLKFYIDGACVDPVTASTLGIVNPAKEETFAQISLGSQASWRRVAKLAADTVKRVAQEPSGKSANIILADADLTRR